MPNDKGEEQEQVVWSIRVTKTLDDIVEKAIRADTHSTKSELIRQAVREKLEKMGVDLTISVG